MIDVEALFFDDDNEAKFANHRVTAGEVQEVHDKWPKYYENGPDRRATHVMVGPTRQGRMLVVPIERVGLPRAVETGHGLPSSAWSGSPVQERKVSDSKFNDPDDDVTLGDLVEAKVPRTRGAVIGVRVSPDLLARLNEYASARDLTVSEVVRRGAELMVDGGSTGPVYHTGVNLKGVGLVYGAASGSMSQGATIPESDKDRVAL